MSTRSTITQRRGLTLRSLAFGLLAAGAFAALVRLVQMSLTTESRGQPFDINRQLVVEISFWGSWVLVAFVSVVAHRWADLRFPDRGIIVRIASHLAVAIAALGLQPLVDAIIIAIAVNPMPLGTSYSRKALFNFMNNLQIYVAGIGAVHAADYYKRYREREAAARDLTGQLATLRLNSLRSQLNPHFLFNSLNAIAMLARQGSTDEVVRMVTGLSDLLRHSLDESKPHLVPLRDELEVARQYVAIEQVRFQDRLDASFEVPAELEKAIVPSFLLQPLIENGILHGFAQSAAARELKISARTEDATLVIDIYNEGRALSGNGSARGLGLRNTRGRLEQLFGPTASIELANHDDGVLCTVRLPLTFADTHD